MTPTQSPYHSHCTLLSCSKMPEGLKISFHAISVLAMPCWPITVPVARIPVLSLFYYLSLNLFFQRVGEDGWTPLESCFPVNLWSLGLNTPQACWLEVTAARLRTEEHRSSSMLYLTTCARSEAVSNGEYKPWIICFTSHFTWLVSVPPQWDLQVSICTEVVS